MIVLDSVLGTTGPGATYKLSIRLAAYVGTDKQDRVRLKDLVAQAYKIRSDIVHGVASAPRTKGLPELLSALEDATRRVLQRAIREGASGLRRTFTAAISTALGPRWSHFRLATHLSFLDQPFCRMERWAAFSGKRFR